MSEDLKDTCKFLTIGFSIIIISTLLILGIGRLIEMETDNVPITVMVDNKQIYNGPSYAVHVGSSGASTVVVIHGGFLCIFPKYYYVSNNVHVENSKPKIEKE